MSNSNVKQNNNANVISSEDWLEAMRKAAENAPPQIRPYELLDQFDFSYPDKSEEQKKKILKIAENNAELFFNLLRNEYKKRYVDRSYKHPDKEMFQDAIDALDEMKEKYLVLKSKKYSLDQLLEIAQMWMLYLHTIEVMIASISSDIDLLNSAEDLNPVQAKILSNEILSSFNVKLKVAKQLGL